MWWLLCFRSYFQSSNFSGINWQICGGFLEGQVRFGLSGLVRKSSDAGPVQKGPLDGLKPTFRYQFASMSASAI